MKIIKKFSGYSGSNVILFEQNNNFFVEKKVKNPKDIKKIYEILIRDFYVAKIVNIKPNTIIMEYVNGIEIKQYLNSYNEKISNLSNFINNYFKKIKKNTIKYDYSNEIENKLRDISKVIKKDKLIFRLNDLNLKMPKLLNKSFIHGDFTFDNIINVNEKFF